MNCIRVKEIMGLVIISGELAYLLALVFFWLHPLQLMLDNAVTGEEHQVAAAYPSQSWQGITGRMYLY